MIRELGPEDVKGLLPLLRSYQEFYGTNVRPAATLEFFRGVLLEERGTMLEVSEADRPVGFATLYWVPQSTTARTVALLNDLFVHADHRRKGHALALLDAAADAVADRGLAAMTWETGPDNVAAKGAYAKFFLRQDRIARPETWIHYRFETDKSDFD